MQFGKSLIRHTFLIAFAIAGSSSVLLAQSDGASLKWKFEAGDKFEIEIVQDQQMTMNVLGQNITTSNASTSWVTWEVNDVSSEGEASVITSVKRMKMDIVSGPVGQISIDTDKAEDPAGPAQQIGKMIRPIVGAKMNQKMLASGKITEMKVPDEVKKLMGSMPNGAQMIESVSKNATLEFPEKPLKVGDSWTRSVETPSPAGKMKVSSTYKYAGVKKKEQRDFHVFDVDVQMEFLGGGQGPLQGAKLDVKNQKTDGKLYFDAERGRLDHSTVEQDFEIAITVNGQKMDQTIKQKVEMRFQDV